MSATPVALPAPPHATEQQRLTATLVLSALVHGLLILGVGFAVSDNAPLVPTLDVIFSQTSTPLTPKQADFLAQANQQGGGDHDKAQRPRDSQGGIVPQPRAGLAPVPQQRQSAAVQQPPQARVVSSQRGVVADREAHAEDQQRMHQRRQRQGGAQALRFACLQGHHRSDHRAHRGRPASIASNRLPAMFRPNCASSSRTQVGLVTLTSVR